MAFDEMIERDLEASYNTNEFAITATHFFNNEEEPLDVIFDEVTEVVLDKGGYNGVEATVPSISLPTFKAANVTHKSTFLIKGITYAVIEQPKQKDGNTIVYLDAS